ncbi:MAG: hypothetical protein KDI48_01075 [Xanthomonadales bacterium]|nr:hypothetical protein [Xanthomonadales bacterium]
MKAFLDELRRRGVTRAAAVYAVAAWAVIETSATILPALHLPDWTVTLVVVVALIGFPIALIVAWVFDLTRAGVVRTPGRESLPETQVGSQPRGRAVELVVIAVLLGLVGWLGWERLQRPAETAETTQEAGRLDSIAVLPFVNLSGDPSNEYFGDGLAEELLNVLVRIEGLRVTARTSSFQYKGRNLDIREIARDLGVATVLEGSVRRAGERVRITAQLIRATDGFHLWSETFDRELADIFAVQDEISQAIANALQSTLQPTSGGGERRHTSNIAAYEAYLRGRFAMNQRTGPTLERAVEEFRQAIALDPDYAAAYSGLSDSYLLQSDYARLSNAESIRLAEPLARRAIELDPGLAEAHASMGLLLRDQGDKLGSIDAFQRAIELNPSYSPAHHWLALSFQDLGRLRDAMAALQASLRVDPNYISGKRVLLGLLRGTGANEQADAFAAELAAEHADDPLILYTLSGDALSRNRMVAAVRFAAQAATLQPDAPFLRVQLATVLGFAGHIEGADAQVEKLRALAPEHSFIDLWPLQRAVFQQDLMVLREQRGEYLAKLEDTRIRQVYDCAFAGASADPPVIIAACADFLASLDWTAGVDVPTDIGAVVVSLLFAYDAVNDEVHRDQVRAGAEAEVARLQREGLDGDQLRGFMAMLQFLDDRDAEPYLDVLEEWIPLTPITAGALEHDLQYAGVREHPRFQQLIEQRRRAQDEALQQIREIPLP